MGWEKRVIQLGSGSCRTAPVVGAAVLSLILCLGSVSAVAENLPLPFREGFPAGAIMAPWVRDVSAGASLEVKNAGIEFAAPAHRRAHIQRPVGVDLITFSGTVFRWGSIYLVWDANDWCGVGKISPTPFGRFYSAVVVNGRDGEVDHRGIDFGVAHAVRIRLGLNYVRFEYTEDGKHWLTLRTVERPKQFKGAPALIAAGRSYTAAEQPFGVGATASGGYDAAVDGRVSDLYVEKTPSDAVKLGEQTLQGLRKPQVDPATALLNASPDDPTFEKIVGAFPAFKYPREVVGVPAHPMDIGVDYLGRLEVSTWGPPLAWLEAGDPPEAVGREGVPMTRRLLDSYLPIDSLTTSRGGVTYVETVFGWSDGMRVDRPLFAYVKLTARAAGSAAAPQHAALVSADGKRVTWPMTARSPKESQICLRFPYPNPGLAKKIPPSEFEACRREAAAAWKQRLAPAERFDVPDARVMDAYRAWLAYSMLDADTINGYIEPHDGAGFYEEMFGVSVSTHTRALDYYGLHDYATRIIDTQIHFQQPDGLYTQACGLTDPGSFLVSLAKHYKMTGDRPWLQRVSPSIIRQCEWLIRQRKAAPQTGMTRGLIKFRPYNDYPAPVFNYLGNAWCAEGMADVAPLLTGLGMSEGKRYEAEAAQYRKDILESMKAAAFTDHGQRILPLEPDTHRLLKLSKNRGGDYYGLTASSVLETDFLAPNDPRAAWIVDMMEKRGGLIAGVCEFEGGIDHAYTYGYLMNEMKRGEVRKTLLGFWSMLAFGMTRDTYSPVEINQITTGENQLTLPHLYSCSEQLRLLRNLLLREDGAVLWIGEGIPRAWLKPGKHVAIRAAPTEFGEVSCRITALSDGSMEVRLNPPARSAPGEIRLCLREPNRRPISSVRTNPAATVKVSRETIVLKKLAGPVTIRVRFRRSGGG